MGSSPPQDRGSSPLVAGHLRYDTPGRNEDGTDGTPTALTVRHGKPGNGSKREWCASVFGVARWRHAAARLGAVAIIAGALVGGGHGHPRRARTLLSSNHRWPRLSQHPLPCRRHIVGGLGVWSVVRRTGGSR